ncbi:MAG: HalOD1 output domain-containing protein [Haloferacaceae archaeon]
MTHDSDDHTSGRADDTLSRSHSRTPDGEYRTEFGPDETPTVAVTRAVASLDGVAPSDLEPLNDWLDPEALDALAGRRSSDDGVATVSAEFWYRGYEVCVANDGTVTIRRDDL